MTRLRRVCVPEVYNYDSKPSTTFFVLSLPDLSYSTAMTIMSRLHQMTGPIPYHVPLIIDGCEDTGETTFDVISPYTNEVCWTAASATPADAIRAVESAQKAFPTWASTKPTIRRDILLKAADILESRLEENGEFMQTEMGADVPSSTGFIVPLGISMLRDIASRITAICGSVPVVETQGQSAIVFQEPMGVILGIVPW